MIHKQNVIKHAKSKKTGPSDRERLLAWVAMQSILEHEHSQFDRKFHYMEVVISDLWGPPSYYVILQG